MIVGLKEGFQGVVHKIEVNNQVYNVYSKPIINDENVISSLGINIPGELIPCLNESIFIWLHFPSYFAKRVLCIFQ